MKSSLKTLLRVHKTASSIKIKQKKDSPKITFGLPFIVQIDIGVRSQ